MKNRGKITYLYYLIWCEIWYICSYHANPCVCFVGSSHTDPQCFFGPLFCYCFAQVLRRCLAACTRRDEWLQGAAAVIRLGLGLIVSVEMLFGKLPITTYLFFCTIQLYDNPKETHFALCAEYY